jgi:uncharacterized protein YbjT (DUF2867 family)
MILVTGATGNVGRHVLSQAVAAGAKVRALTRRPDSADLPGVDVVGGDLARPETVAPALAGVDAMFLVAAYGGAGTVVDAAVRAGVRHIVFLSSASVRDDLAEQDNEIAAHHAAIEQEIAASGLEWTFVRPGGFATNALRWAPQIRATGTVRGPYADAAQAPIHEADIGAVAATALIGGDHAGRTYELTGPESLTHADQARIIGEVIGREVRYDELSPEEAREQMGRYLSAGILDTLFGFWAAAAGQPATVLPTVEQVTGQVPRTFREWATEHADDFR